MIGRSRAKVLLKYAATLPPTVEPDVALQLAWFRTARDGLRLPERVVASLYRAKSGWLLEPQEGYKGGEAYWRSAIAADADTLSAECWAALDRVWVQYARSGVALGPYTGVVAGVYDPRNVSRHQRQLHGLFSLVYTFPALLLARAMQAGCGDVYRDPPCATVVGPRGVATPRLRAREHYDDVTLLLGATHTLARTQCLAEAGYELWGPAKKQMPFVRDGQLHVLSDWWKPVPVYGGGGTWRGGLSTTDNALREQYARLAVRAGGLAGARTHSGTLVDRTLAFPAHPRFEQRVLARWREWLGPIHHYLSPTVQLPLSWA